MPLAAIYRRVSTDDQDASLVLQEERMTAYTTFKQLQVAPGLTFADPDTSGRTPMLDRTGGRALMNRLRLGDVQHLVVAKLDRLGRNVRDGLKTIEFLKEQGVTLHITDFGGEAISTQGHVGKLILTMLLAVSEWEVEEIRDRTLKNAIAKFNRNELTGNIPFGFDCVYTFADGPAETHAKALSAAVLAGRQAVSKILIANDAEQAVIRTMHQIRHTRTATRATTPLQVVADELNALGHRTKQGCLWSSGSVDSVLTSRYTQKVLNAQTSALAV